MSAKSNPAPTTSSPIVLVTGANRGIGLELCRQLALRGARVFLGARDPALGLEAAASLREQGLTVETLTLDVADERSVKALVAELDGRAERLDVLINNAAVLGPNDDDVSKITTELLLRTLDVNVAGALRMAQACAPLLRRSSSPRIVNVSSEGGSLTLMSHWAPAYSMSKSALNALTRQLAAALGPKIAVNSACPGWVRTRMGGAGATLSVEQGADTIVWIALHPSPSPTGRFFQERKEIPW